MNDTFASKAIGPASPSPGTAAFPADTNTTYENEEGRMTYKNSPPRYLPFCPRPASARTTTVKSLATLITMEG